MHGTTFTAPGRVGNPGGSPRADTPPGGGQIRTLAIGSTSILSLCQAKRGLGLTPATVFLLLVMVFFVSPASANFNLYLKKPEVKRTLGLNAELYYIREGVLNEYALSYKVLVAADISMLYFTWEATARKPIEYSMSVSVGKSEEEAGAVVPGTSSPQALGLPSVNISLTGVVPNEVSTFRLHLPCTGLDSAEVPLTLTINFTSPRPRGPFTSVFIRRRKICLKGQFSEQYSRHLDTPEDAHPVLPAALYYGVSAAVGFSLVVTTIVIVAVVRRKKLKQITDQHIYCSDIGSMKSFQHGSGGSERGRTQSFARRSATVSNTYAVPDGISINSYATPFTTCRQPTLISTITSKHSHKNSTFQDHTDIFKDLSKEIVGNLSKNSSRVFSTENNTKKNNYLDGIHKQNSTFEHERSRKGNRSGMTRSCSKSGSYKYLGRSGSHNLSKTDKMKKKSSSHSLLTSSLSIRSEVVVSPSAADLQDKFKQMKISSSDVSLRSLVQEGSFSKVYQGSVRGGRSGQDQEVLIKTVGESSTLEFRVVLCREGARFFNLYHCNVLTLMGIAFMDNTLPYLIYPLQGYQNLKLYLLGESNSRPLRAKQLVEVGLQAAQGMAFLHHANVLHTDIAARNCMINSHLQLRLCDSGLSQDLFPGDYDVLPPDTARPIKWLAYEAIIGHIISSATDVWAYGVLLWELSTCGQQPYAEVVASEMRDYLHDGYRLAQPQHCPPELYKVMAFCWAIRAHDRPHAKLIINFLTDFHQRLV
ncbi:unnamed protein product [Meganyctiphanes norvegica]|uniref:Tyrosine-protein kinase Dnt n=1 Tax=Meganyctiphanes norvegica TaxID=48144 RepID=A0AAV2PNE2_MEGNR